MFTNKLCTELHERIIGFLRDDDSALRCCSLVCRAWVPASRSHLLYHPVLTGNTSTTNSWEPNTSCRRLFAAILSSPHIASYIEKLTVHETLLARPFTYRWVTGEIMFPPLLKKLKFLRELEFNFPTAGPSDRKTNWSTMVFKDISEALSTLALESFTLRHFAFATVLDVIKFLDSCRHLKTLQLDNVDIANATQMSVSSLESVLDSRESETFVRHSGKKANLECLMLKSNYSDSIIPILLHDRSPLDLSGVLSLNVNVTAADYYHFVGLLRHTPSLEFLEMEIESSFDFSAHLDVKDLIDLYYIPSLKFLNLQVSLLLGRTDPLPWLLAFLSTIGLHNKLEEISLKFVIDKPPPSLTIQSFDNALSGWRDLDDLLHQPTFAGLRRVRLDFALDSPIGDDSLQDISDHFIIQLQALAKKGVLEVDVCELR